MRARLSLLACIAGVVVAMAVPASASAQPEQTGLVNVAITNNVVQVPIAVAANVCGVQVGILASDLRQGPVDCDADANAVAEAAVDRGNGGNGGSQTGLVNIWISDNTVQIPVGIAANICGVQVGALAVDLAQGPVNCNAQGNGTAEVNPF